MQVKEVSSQDLYELCKTLKEKPYNFAQLIDLYGIDYLYYTGKNHNNDKRFAVFYHLLSNKNNKRLIVRCYCDDDNIPQLPSVTSIWPSANFYEREVFDLFGILFENHPNLNRILTDYDFKGYPLRKDFPLSGLIKEAQK